VARDYNFWVYIVTNEHESVLYVGMTNDLARRISEHRAGEIPGFTADYRCTKLIYYEHCTDAGDPRRIVRDVSTALDMTKGGTERGSDILHRRFSALLSFRAKSRNL